MFTNISITLQDIVNGKQRCAEEIFVVRLSSRAKFFAFFLHSHVNVVISAPALNICSLPEVTDVMVFKIFKSSRWHNEKSNCIGKLHSLPCLNK